MNIIIIIIIGTEKPQETFPVVSRSLYTDINARGNTLKVYWAIALHQRQGSTFPACMLFILHAHLTIDDTEI